MSVLTHGKRGNTQTGKMHDTQSRLRNTELSLSDFKITENSSKSRRFQAASTIVAVDRLTNRRVTRSAKEPALNKQDTETNYTG